MLVYLCTIGFALVSKRMVEIYHCIISFNFVRLLLEEVDWAVEEELQNILEEPSHQAAKLACESEAAPVLKIKVWLENLHVSATARGSGRYLFGKAQTSVADHSVITMSADTRLFSATIRMFWDFSKLLE